MLVFGAATLGAGAGGGQTPAQLAALLSKPNWKYPAEFINCKTATPNGCNSNKKISGTYTPLPVSQITKQWKICVSFPHLKDPYWLSVNSGAVQESKRDKVKMKLVEAGGYTNLPTQLDQLDNCSAAGADALVIGAGAAGACAVTVCAAIGRPMPTTNTSTTEIRIRHSTFGIRHSPFSIRQPPGASRACSRR